MKTEAVETRDDGSYCSIATEFPSYKMKLFRDELGDDSPTREGVYATELCIFKWW